MKGMIDLTDRYGYRYQQKSVGRSEPCPGSLTPLPANFTVAMLYVPMQIDTTMFDEMKAFECGSLFPVLSKPFAGKCCK